MRLPRSLRAVPGPGRPRVPDSADAPADENGRQRWTAAAVCRTLPRLMCQCPLCADRFLRGLLGVAPFADYCRRRKIRLPSRLSERDWGETVRWWAGMLRGLPDRVRARVE